MKPEQLNSTLMPLAFYGLGIVWVVSLASLLWNQLIHPDDFTLVIIFIYLLVGLYIWRSFYLYKTIKYDGNEYFLRNMLTNKTDAIKKAQLIKIRPFKYIGMLAPWNKVFEYKDADGKNRKTFFVEKLKIL